MVYRGTFFGKDVAVKIIPVNCMEVNSEREANLQRNLKHENVLELLSVEEDAFNKYGRLRDLVMKYSYHHDSNHRHYRNVTHSP